MVADRPRRRESAGTNRPPRERDRAGKAGKALKYNVKIAYIYAVSAVLSGCMAPSAAQLAQNNPKSMVAASLGLYKDAKTATFYEISDPWTALTGEVMVCVAAHLPDGKG